MIIICAGAEYAEHSKDLGLSLSNEFSVESLTLTSDSDCMAELKGRLSSLLYASVPVLLVLDAKAFLEHPEREDLLQIFRQVPEYMRLFAFASSGETRDELLELGIEPAELAGLFPSRTQVLRHAPDEARRIHGAQPWKGREAKETARQRLALRPHAHAGVDSYLKELTGAIDRDAHSLSMYFVGARYERDLEPFEVDHTDGAELGYEQSALTHLREQIDAAPGALGGPKEGNAKYMPLFLLIGEKGAGKSTLCSYLTHFPRSAKKARRKKAMVLKVDCLSATPDIPAEWQDKMLSLFHRVTKHSVANGQALQTARKELQGDDDTEAPKMSRSEVRELEALCTEQILRSLYVRWQAKAKKSDLMALLTSEDPEAVAAFEAWHVSEYRRPFRLLCRLVIWDRESKKGRLRRFLIDQLRKVLADKLEVALRRNHKLDETQNLSKREAAGVERRLLKWWEHPEGSTTERIKEALECLRSGEVDEDEVVELLQSLSEIVGIVLIFDNIDHQENYYYERILAEQVFAVLESLFTHFEFSSIVAMRQSTWGRMEEYRKFKGETYRWEEVPIEPAPLTVVLARRSQVLQRQAAMFGERGQMAAMFYSYVVRSIVENKDAGIDELIRKRHPFDIRQQLQLVSDLLASQPMLEEGLERFIGHGPSTYLWSRLNWHFGMRALLWGRNSFYREKDQKVAPNLTNNTFAKSRSNGLMRYYVMLRVNQCLDDEDIFELQDVVEPMTKLGFKEEQVTKALESLIRCDVLREVSWDLSEEDYFGGVPNKYQLSIWGRFFWDNVAVSLAYAEVIWWDSDKPADLARKGREQFGDVPRLFHPSELDEFVDAVLEWINREENYFWDGVDYEEAVKMGLAPQSYLHRLAESLGAAIKGVAKALGKPDRANPGAERASAEDADR